MLRPTYVLEVLLASARDEEVLSRNQIRNGSIASRSRALAYTNEMGNFITINRYLLYAKRNLLRLLLRLLSAEVRQIDKNPNSHPSFIKLRPIKSNR